MKFLNQLTTKPEKFQRTFGLSLEQFNLLVERIDPLWRAAEVARKTRSDRKRKPGGGHPFKLTTTNQILSATLMYYKLYLTQEFLGLIVGLDQSNISRLLAKMLPLIEQAADPELSTYLARAKEEYALHQYNKIKDWQSFFRKHPDLKDVSSDATEQKRYRPQNYDQQKDYYSGKKKHHSLKTQISTSETGRILDVSKTYPGRIHDKNILDQEKTVQKFPEKMPHRFDLGYQGAVTDYPNYYLILPFKKPRKKELPALYKELNQAHSRRRVIVENAISRAKKFRILGGLYRGPLGSYNQIFRNVASILNFRHAHLESTK